MMQDLWASAGAGGGLHSASFAIPRPPKPSPTSTPIAGTLPDSFHVAHKVPAGNSPYVRAKRVQLVDKDPEKAIALFWAAINAGDRVDSALKDMAIVMKQQSRAEEAIEAIRSLRSRCSDQAQESLDNILLDLYKRCGRLDDQIALLKHKLGLIQQGLAFNGKRTKTARSQGRKFQVSLEQEATRLLGNLGWALMQKESYMEAEAAYRQALLIGPDNNKMCNLGICLMKQGKILQAKQTLKQVSRPVASAAASDGPRSSGDSHLKAFERAQEMLRDLESKVLGVGRASGDLLLFEAFSGSSPSLSSIWQPQPCIDYPPWPSSSSPSPDIFPDENVFAGAILAKNNVLNISAQPFYSAKNSSGNIAGADYATASSIVGDPLGNLKRTRSGSLTTVDKATAGVLRKPSLSVPQELPDDDAFNEAIVAAVLDDDKGTRRITTAAVAMAVAAATSPAKVGKRLRVFQDITLSLNSSGS